MLATLKVVVIFLLVLSVLVIIHELAHFLAAVWQKVRVLEFGVGFPPRVKKLFTWKKTLFSLNLLPIGGFVSMAGEIDDKTSSNSDFNAFEQSRTARLEKINPRRTESTPADDFCSKTSNSSVCESLKTQSFSSSDSKNTMGSDNQDSSENYGIKAEKIPRSELFYNKKAWQKAVVVAAGPIANLLLGGVLFAIVFCVIGIPIKQEGAYIGYVQEGSPAEQGGLVVGMNIEAMRTATGGSTWQNATSSASVGEFATSHRGEEIVLQVRDVEKYGCSQPRCVVAPCEEICGIGREVKNLVIYVRTAEETPEGEGAMGIAFSEYEYKFYPWYQQIPLGIVEGFKQSWEMIVLIVDSLGQMLKTLVGQQEKSTQLDVVGPVGMVSQIKAQGLFENGVLSIMQFAAVLSVNLGVMNLLPFPALDGGKLVMIFLGKIFGKKKVAKVEKYLDMVGFALLLLLMLIVTTRDVWRIVAR